MLINHRSLITLAVLIGVMISIISVKLNFIAVIIAALFISLVFFKVEFILIGLILSVNNVFFLITNSNSESLILIFSFLTILILIFYLISGRLRETVFINMKFKYLWSIFILLIVIGILNSYFLFQQPIWLGIKAAKWYLIIVIYFLLSYLLINNLISVRKIVNIVISIGFIASIIYIIQFFLYDKYQFLNVNFLERFGEVRFYQGVNIVIFSLVLGIQRVLEKGKVSIMLAVACSVNFFYILVVANSRSLTIPLLIALLYILFLQKKFNKTIIIYALLGFSIYLFNSKDSNLFIKTFSLLINDISNNDGTFGFRIKEINYYLSEISRNFVLGMGILSESHSPSYFALGKQFNYYLSDIGMIGFFFKFGIIGVLLVCAIVLSMIKKNLYLWQKKVYRFDLIAYVIYLLFAMWFVPLFDNASSLLCICIALALIDYEIFKTQLRSLR
ncbi:Lipid A core - O-antigen ligase and related enzymes [Priestia megaterium]|uniref:O-antigen ligase family protein n=1 Tax=Priestia megaterium TaxID=1404 RepID=UPI000E190CAF|nr:O-antigen ligase family protein [Priestia megaterium]SUV02259.1 Lipid A core - O-antigen ligase and related enzymes [Priestia megaterium]